MTKERLESIAVAALIGLGIASVLTPGVMLAYVFVLFVVAVFVYRWAVK